MSFASAISPQSVIGRPPECLTLDERNQLLGKIIALEIYSPKTLPLRRIEAIGDTAEECMRQLTDRGLDPRKFEFQRLEPPY